MSEEVIDIIHKLSYIVESDSLTKVSNELTSQIGRLDILGKRAQKLSEAYDKTAATELAKRERIKKLIIETQRAIEKEGDAIEHTVTQNKDLERALQKQIGIVGALEQKMQLLRDRRDRAFDVDKIKAYNKEIAKGENELRALRGGGVDKKEGLFGPIVGGNLVAGLVSQAGAALKGFATDIVSTTAKYEKLSALLANTLGGKQAGADAFKLLTDFAADTPFQLDELTASYLKLVNRGIKPTKEELTAFGDIAAAQGKSFDQFTEAVLDATTGEFERLKEFGIKATQQGDKVTLAFGNITKTVPKTGEAIKKALLEIRNEAPGIAGAMKVISGTIEGQLSNLSDGFDRLKSNLGARFQDSIKSSISAVSDLVGWFNDLVEVPVADKIEMERIEFNSLVLALTDVNTSSETRSQIISELNQKYPELIKNIDLEKDSQEKLLGFLDGVNKAYEHKIELAALSQISKEASDEAIEAQKKELSAVRALNKELAKLGFTRSEIAKGVTREQIEQKTDRTSGGGFAGAAVESNTGRALELLGRREAARAELKKALDEGVLADQAIASRNAEITTEDQKNIEQYTNAINKYQAAIDGIKKKLQGATPAETIANGLANPELAQKLQKFQQYVDTYQGLLIGLTNANAKAKASGVTTPPAIAPTKSKKQKTPEQVATEQENERFEKELAELQKKFNQQRLDARKKFADDDEALGKELLRIKEEQDAETFLITTERETSHQKNLLEIYRKFKGIKSVEYAKESADIVKATEDRAAQLEEIEKRNAAKLAAAKKQAIKDEIDRINKARKQIDDDTETKRARNERVKNITITNVNKTTSAKAAKDLIESIEREFKIKDLDIQITGLKIKLNDPKLQLSDKDIEQLKDQLAALEAQLSGLKNAGTIPKKNDPHNPNNAGIADLNGNDIIERQEKVIAYYDTITTASKEAADAIIADEIRILDAQILLQNKRVEQAGKIADRGNAELLQREEKRLTELQKKRDAYAKAEMITNNLLTISNAVLAVAKAAAAGGGYASIALVAAVIAALVAGYSVVRTVTNDTGGFKEGGYTGDGDVNKPAGVVHGKEFVMHAKATERYRPLLEEMNKMRHSVVPPVLIDTWTPKYLYEQRAAANHDYRRSFEKLEKRLGAIEEAIISKPNTSLTVDRNGIAASVEEVIIRKERIRNL